MPERTIVMARKRKVTSEVIESMKMLHDQGVKVAMIADVLSFSKWTVYQAKNADWNLDTYVTKTRAHFEAQKKDVRDTSIVLSSSASLNGESSVIPTDGLLNLSKLTLEGFVDTVRSLDRVCAEVHNINVTLRRLEKTFQHIDDELTGESTTV